MGHCMARTRDNAPGSGGAYWMLIPAVAFTLLLIGLPFLYTIYLSLHQFVFGKDAVFNAGRNYLLMLQDRLFWNGLWVTLVLYGISLALQMAFGLYLGMLLDRSVRGRGLLRTILISPFVMPSVVVGMMWLVILDPSIGAANFVLESLGLPRSTWLASPLLVVPTIALIDTWQWTPFVALIILGGMQVLPIEPYEAASIDGAKRWQTFRYITLPLLRPAMITAATLRSVDLLRFFDTIYITTQGGPSNASTTLNIYAFRVGFEFFDIGYASAQMITLLAIVFGAVMAFAQLRRHAL
jgi:multiple sugar transport system permease protein